MYLLAKELILEDYITTILVVLVAILFAVFSKRIVHLFTSRFKIDSEVINILSKLLAIFALCLGSFYALSNLGVRIGPILGTVGIGGIALAFALQNLVLNLLGSVLIHSRRPFRTGDQIEFTEHEGTVVDINTRTVVLLTYGGNLVHIPNAKIMDEPFVNLTKEQSRRSSLDILVAYGTDLQLAASVAIEAIRSCSDVTNEMLADALVTQFMNFGINMELRFWHPSEQLLANKVVNDVAIAVYDAFNSNGIEIPLPQSVIHYAKGS